ncbi:MAG: hypothetical protein QW822_04470 [Desulfurococcaceae archaeon]
MMRDSISFRIVKIRENGDLEDIISSSDLGRDTVIKSLQAVHEKDVIVFSNSIGGLM